MGVVKSIQNLTRKMNVFNAPLGLFDELNGVVVGYADCYSKGPGFESRVSHGPCQKV
jgi:hypothetical protein